MLYVKVLFTVFSQSHNWSEGIEGTWVLERFRECFPLNDGKVWNEPWSSGPSVQPKWINELFRGSHVSTCFPLLTKIKVCLYVWTIFFFKENKSGCMGLRLHRLGPVFTPIVLVCEWISRYLRYHWGLQGSSGNRAQQLHTLQAGQDWRTEETEEI